MRSYQKKILRQSIKNVVSRKQETRNAIVWSIDADNEFCRVKIQGSNKLITAWFPLNWGGVPSWLRVKGAVTVVHPAGSRGRIEVLGPGKIIPAPVEGGGQFPDTGVSDDAIISGFFVKATKPPTMSVIVNDGTARFSGTIYDVTGETLSLTALTDPFYVRYDVISVWRDPDSGLIDLYVTEGSVGIYNDEGPTIPSPPSGHLVIATVLIQGQSSGSVIEQININREWTAPAPTSISVVVGDDDLGWYEATTQITVSLLDQYERAISAPYGTYYVYSAVFHTQIFYKGNGDLYSTYSGWKSSTVNDGYVESGHVGTSSYVFTYRRLQTLSDKSPFIKLAVDWNGDLTFNDYVFITLRNDSGTVMM